MRRPNVVALGDYGARGLEIAKPFDIHAWWMVPGSSLRVDCAAIPEFWLEVDCGPESPKASGRIGVRTEFIVTRLDGNSVYVAATNDPGFWVLLWW